jgi:hypothetical protein
MSENILLTLKGSYILVPIVIFLSLIVSFINAQITKTKVSNSDYIKISLLAAIISMGCIYINTIKGHIQEEVLTGAAPF